MSATPLKTWSQAKGRSIAILSLVAGLSVGSSFGYLLGFRQKTVDVAVAKAVENEQMRFADEGMTRSRTNFARPGITQEQVDQIKMISADYGTPEEMLYAMYRSERGRMGLYLGANYVPPEIRKRYPPLMWQFAMGAKTWNQHLNKMVMVDPYLSRRVLWSFAKQWNPTPDKWTHNVLSNLELARDKGLEVTEPPKPKSKPTPVRKQGK